MVRGELRRLPAQRTRGGHEQQGARYAVIVQSDDLLVLSTALVAPTSRSARAASFRPLIEIDGTPTRVMVDQTSVVDIERLGDLAGRLGADELRAVDDAVRLVLGL
jgi:mRNA interferase MazF